LWSWLKNNMNFILEQIINKTFPFFYFKSCYKKNKGRIWKGRKSCFSLSFDLDYTEDVRALPVLLDVLGDFKTGFACVGKLIEKYPKEHKMIAEKGHEIINHTYSHPNSWELNPLEKFNELDYFGQKQEIEKCHSVCQSILKISPIGFRTPHFGDLHAESVYPILKELGYKYSSSTLGIKNPRMGTPFKNQGITEIPLTGCPFHPFSAFDTCHCLGRGEGKHAKPGEFYSLFKKLIDLGIETNSYINLYFDPQDIIQCQDFKKMLDYIESQKENLLIPLYKDILIDF